MQDLVSKLNEIYECKIISYKFDLLYNTITFKTHNLSTNEFNDIVFKKVSAFHFYRCTGNQRFSIGIPDDDAYLEFTQIAYFPNGVGDFIIIPHSGYEQIAEQNFSEANFSIEIWEETLYIEAGIISINDIEFIVK